ncbi:MAG: hypothetical protein GX970_14605 [Phyllobacteriaceae bacterium]|nr:hypothetical protein [Phyllobacteriaceae bacterium]
MNRKIIISIVVAVVVIAFAVTMFAANNQAPEVEGGRTADDPADQPAVLTP